MHSRSMSLRKVIKHNNVVPILNEGIYGSAPNISGSPRHQNHHKDSGESSNESNFFPSYAKGESQTALAFAGRLFK